MRTSDNEITQTAYCKAPDVSMMSLKGQEQLKFVSIPVFYKAIFPHAEHIMCIAHKLHCHNAATDGRAHQDIA